MAFHEPGDGVALASSVRDGFHDRFGRLAVAVGRAPGRVNLIGEHTDYNRGLVLPVALPHATHVAAAPRADDTVRVSSAQQDDLWQGTLSSLDDGADSGWAGYAVGVLWALREDGVPVPGFDLHVDSRVPLGAGLSSSAALECAVAVAATSALGQDLDVAARRRLVAACIRAETEVVGAPTGGMDQTVSMLAEGGCAVLVDFDVEVQDAVRSVPLRLEGQVLLVTDTRVSHALIDGGYAARRADCERAAEILGVPSLRQADLVSLQRLEDPRLLRRARHVVTEIQRVREAVAALDSGDVDVLGRVFAASHASLRDDFEVSCSELDVAVDAAVAAGARAARMTGGGFGGSSVAVVPEGRVDEVVDAIDAAFADHGFAAPRHLLATPSEGARVV